MSICVGVYVLKYQEITESHFMLPDPAQLKYCITFKQLATLSKFINILALLPHIKAQTLILTRCYTVVAI